VGIEELADHFTYSLYANVCRSLFEKDKLLFSFLLAAKLGQAKQALTAGEYELLVQPQESLDESRCLLTNECVDWLPNAQWSTLGRMASSSPAIDAVVQEFAAQSQAWRVVAESDSPMREAFPTVDLGAGPSALSPFLKLCVVKAIAPGKFVTAVREFVLQELGERYLSPPLFDIECSYNDSSSTAPLIFVLPGSDPLQALTAFAKRKKKLDGLKTISLGQGQGARAEAAIAQARKDGGWVLL
jgi:dynein heavy chain